MKTVQKHSRFAQDWPGFFTYSHINLFLAILYVATRIKVTGPAFLSDVISFKTSHGFPAGFGSVCTGKVSFMLFRKSHLLGLSKASSP